MDLSKLSDEELQKIANGETDHDSVVKKMSDEDLQRIVSGEPKYSATQAAVMHGINKATGGFSDELQGLGEAAGRVVGVQGAGGPMKDMGLAPHGPTLDWETLRDAYRAARDHERETLKQQEKEHPIASGAGDVVGAVVSPINKVAKGMSLAKGGAVLGGINALGSTEKEDLPGMAIDTALGVGVGGITGGVLQKAAPMVGSAAGGLKNTIEEVATAPLGKDVPVPTAPVKKVFDPFIKKASEIAGPEPEAPGLITKTMQGVQSAGEKANAALAPIPKWARYLAPGPSKWLQGAVDAAENAPKAAQWAAGKAANGLDSASQFLLKSPRLQELAQNSPKAFSAMAGDLSSKFQQNGPQAVARKPNQAPVDEQQARQAFLDGN